LASHEKSDSLGVENLCIPSFGNHVMEAGSINTPPIFTIQGDYFWRIYRTFLTPFFLCATEPFTILSGLTVSEKRFSGGKLI